MVKRTLEVFECDICGADGRRYLVMYEDGQMVLDRCERHNGKLEKLRDEKGSWTTKSPGHKSSFKVSNIDDIRRQLP